MKFSIRAVLGFTLIIAIAFLTFKRWVGLEARRKEIQDLEVAIAALKYDPRQVQAHLEACQAAVNDTVIPSAAYRSAEANFRRLNAGEEFGRGE